MDGELKHILSANTPSAGIAVFGAINIDIICQTKDFPGPGEVTYGTSVSLTLGGKGMNVGVALRRLGIPVYMVGTVGNDTLGNEAVTIMRKNRIGTTFVGQFEGEQTGSAIILVGHDGKNRMVVNAGANDSTENSKVHEFFASVDAGKTSAKMIYLTLELPREIILQAVTEASRRNIPVFCQAEPWAWLDHLPESYYTDIEFFSVNRKGAEAISGVTINGFGDAEAAALAIRGKGARNIIITLGEDGSLLLPAGNDKATYYPASTIQARDTTAAGDAFRAAFLSSYVRHGNLDNAMVFATIAGEYTASTPGTYDSMPQLKDLTFASVVYKKLGINNLILDYNGVLSFDFHLVYKNVMNLFRKFGKEEMTYEAFRREFFYPLPTFYAKHIPEASFDELQAAYFAGYSDEGSPSIYANARRTLERLAEKHVNMVIFSSHTKDKILKELHDYDIPTGLFTNIYGDVKDKISLIKKIISENNFDPSQTAYIGDTEHDIQTAKEAGITSIASTFGYLSKERLALAVPDIYIRNIEELVDIV